MGYQKKERGEWERARWIMYFVTAPYVKKGRPLKPETLLPFPWDVADKPKELTEAELAELEAAVKESLAFWERADKIRDKKKATYESIIRA